MEFLDKIFHPLEDFIYPLEDDLKNIDKVTYYYQGICPKTEKKLKLPRTILAEKIALRLCAKLEENNLSTTKGKMLGILVVKDKWGKYGVIKAFSGLWNGKKQIRGWVEQISSNGLIILAEKLTLQKLNIIKDKILLLEKLPIRQEYKVLKNKFGEELQQLKKIHLERKKKRDNQRQSLSLSNKDEIEMRKIIDDLAEESKRDDWEQKKLKRSWRKILQPLDEKINQADEKIKQLKQERKQLSRQLQAQMQTAYTLTNFAGNSLSVGEIMGKEIDFIPTGTGDCCAPKLLHYAAQNGLIPLAMAEIWWGETSPNGEKVRGNFYPACEERCQPLMGFLLSGLPSVDPVDLSLSIPIIYEDDYLLVVNKPSGLLSVSGRGSERFDSVVSRFRQIFTANSHFHLNTVHRLDQDTSGILILTKDRDSYIHLSRQFEQRQVEKVYSAMVLGVIETNEGVIDLPLWGNPENRPLQEVNYERGKPSLTKYSVVGVESNYTRLRLIPLTGRTHQLRVHCGKGLGLPIRGDRLYGGFRNGDERLYLHAREITFIHPYSKKVIHLQTETPF